MIPFWNTINPTSFSYQSHLRWSFNDARVGKSPSVFCATEKCAWENHHGKGWYAPRLSISKQNPRWRKKSVFTQVIMPKPEKDLTRSKTTNSTVLWKTKCQNSTRVATKKLVRVKLLWKKKAIQGISNLLEMSIFLWAQHPDLAGLFGLTVDSIFKVHSWPGGQLSLRNGASTCGCWQLLSLVHWN